MLTRVGIILGGLTSAITGGTTLFKGIPSQFVTLGQDRILGLNHSAWVVILIAIILGYALGFTPLGRRWYAIKGSERVAHVARVRARGLRVSAFVGAGILLAVGFNGLSRLGVPFWAQPVFNGVVLLAAVFGARAESRSLRGG